MSVTSSDTIAFEIICLIAESSSSLGLPVGVEEVENIASFIAGLDPNIPYSLLAFYPQFYMNDLPTTSKKEAMECMGAAKKYMKRVRIGNIHLLS